MTKKATNSGQAADFCKQAEEIARKTEGLSQEKLEAMKPDEIRQTLHELQVHQIEVEMQNEELRLAGAELKALHERYFDLYDMAPVGYFTISEKGLIIEANLTIATMLGITKSNLVKHPLSRFISKEDQEIYYLHRNQLFENGKPQTFELRMVKKNKTTFWAYLEAIAAQDNQGKPVCRVTISDMSTRKQSEEALRESEALQRTLLDNLPAGVIIVDPVTRLIERANNHVANMFGASVDHLIGKRCHSLLCPADEGSCPVCDLGKTVDNSDREMLRMDGSRLPILKTVKRIQLDGQDKLLECFVDVSTRKLAEETLKASEQSYRNQFTKNSSVMLLVDPADGAILDANTAALGFYGYSEENLLAMRITDINLLPASEVRQAMASITKEKGKRFEFQHRLADGSTRNVEVSSSRIQFGGRTVLHSIINDVTKRKLAEEGLLEVKERLSLAVRAGGIGTWDFDTVNNVLVWDEGMFRLYGITPDQFGGAYEAWQAGVHPEERQRGDEEIQLALRGEKEFDTEFRVVWPDGTIRNIRALALVQRDAAGQPLHMIGTNWDITDQKKAEEALTKAKGEAEEANKAKSEFLSGMSHEIRTPMNAIVGMADLLMESELTADQRIYVETSRNAGENLLELINGILDLSKVEAGLVVLEKTEFDLDSIMNKVCDLMYLKTKGSSIRIACAPLHNIPATLIGDPQRLMQIFINLVGNAMKFTKQGEIILGVETISGSLDFEDKESVELRFFVKDTGIGIPPDKVELIFEMFTQADSSTTRKYGGTGLGLHISKHLVELMGGRIWVESDVGKGSTFFFTATFGIGKTAIPLAEKTEVASSVGDKPVEQRTLNILLVEDNDDNRLLLLYYLKKTPHHVDVAENGAIAVEKFSSGKYDLVLMDVQMPVMDGYTATGEIRKLEESRGLKRTSVLALTAYAMKKDEQKSLEAGCDCHLTKPIRKDVLLEAIEKYGNTLR